MATRYIGNAVIRITYNDAGDYRGTVSAGGYVWTFTGLRPPACGFRCAYDSSEAYDRMASAAVSFGSDSAVASNTDDDSITDEGRELASAISDATGCELTAAGAYMVRRSMNGPAREVA